MDAGLFVRGLVIGLSIAASVGPMSILCIRRTLAEGQLTGLMTGMGIATADGGHALLAAFGVTFITNLMIDYRIWLQLVGGAFLCYLGLRTLLTTPARRSVAGEAGSIMGAYASTVALTMTNPMTILSFGAIFAGLGLAAQGSYSVGGTLVLGVFLGSCVWWLILTTAVASVRERLSDGVLRGLNWVSGGAIVAFGALALAGALLRN